MGINDLLAMLDVWGQCPPPPAAARWVVRGDADLDEDGRIGSGDLRVLMSAWKTGAPGTLGDLDGDGRIGVADHLRPFAVWGSRDD